MNVIMAVKTNNYDDVDDSYMVVMLMTKMMIVFIMMN